MTSLEEWVDGPTLSDLQLCCTAPGCTGATPCNACVLETDRCQECEGVPSIVLRPPGFSPIALCALCERALDDCVPRPVEAEVTSQVFVNDLLYREIARQRWAL